MGPPNSDIFLLIKIEEGNQDVAREIERARQGEKLLLRVLGLSKKYEKRGKYVLYTISRKTISDLLRKLAKIRENGQSSFRNRDLFPA